MSFLKGLRTAIGLVICGICCVVGVFSLCSCDESSAQRQHLTVSVWDYSLISSGFSDYIDARNPDYDIEWIVGKDDLDFYVEQSVQGSLPDVVLVSNFEDQKAAKLQDSLLDLGDSSISDGFESDMSRSVSGDEGALRWLFAPGTYEGIIVNSYLFDLYDVEVPTDQQSFMDACRAFEEKGVRGFVSGYADAATCSKTVQGLALDSFTSSAGESWVKAYEKGLTSTIDQGVWEASLGRVSAYVDAGIIQGQDVGLTPAAARQMFIEGSAAMMFVSEGNISDFANKYNMTVRALPFFDGAQAVAMEEPAFYGAASGVVTEKVKVNDEETPQRAAAKQVLGSIMDEEGQRHYRSAMNVDTALPFSEHMDLVLPQSLESISACIADGSVYHPFSDDDLQEIVTSVVSHRATGVSDNLYSEAADLLAKRKKTDTHIVATFSQGYSNVWNRSDGNEAASSIACVAALRSGSDFFILSPQSAQCPLYSGSKTKNQLSYPVADNPIYNGTLSGARISAYLSECVSRANSVYDLPVVSGLRMTIIETEGAFKLVALERIVTDGTQSSTSSEVRQHAEALDLNALYTVGLSDFGAGELVADAPMLGLTMGATTLQDEWMGYFTDDPAAKLANPESYLSFA